MTRLSRLSIYGLLILIVLVWLIPLYTMATTSFKTPREVAEGAYLALPRNLNLENYQEAFSVLQGGLVNSSIVAILATLVCILVGSWAGFFLALLKFRYSNAVFMITSIATFLPYQIVLFPLTQFIVSIGLMRTHAGMIVAYTILNTPMAALITATFFQKVPPELQEAAALDGCGPVTFYWRILLPVARLGILSAAILIFTMIWNEFLIALSFTLGTPAQMATPALANLKGSDAVQWQLLMAGSLLTSLPPLAIFIFLGRYYVAGLMAGATKGGA